MDNRMTIITVNRDEIWTYKIR